MNILLISVDAMQTGGTIIVSAKERDDQVVIAVTDTGCGMNKHTREHCLEPFFTTKGVQATGMGLAVAYGTVRRHAGTIEVDSTPGQGTIVTIRLPLSFEPDEDLPTHKPGATPALPPLKILIIDDDAKVRSTYETMLKTGRHELTLVATGGEGIRTAQEKPFDLIITDRAMPDMSGDEVAETIHKAKPDTPIIMITGFGGLMHEQHTKPIGVSRILPKPVDALSLKWALYDLTQ